MKLNWFSPLPPAKSGIAEYTAGLLPLLARHADVTVWTDQREWDAALEKHSTVRRFDVTDIKWSDLNSADISFYNIGNNHLFHASIWQISKMQPGIVILHDVHLHQFFDSLYNGLWRDLAGYLAQMETHYGAAGRQAGVEFVTGKTGIDSMLEKYPLTSLGLENCLGCIVHTQDAFDQLSKDNRYAVVYAPLPAVFGTPPKGEPTMLRSIEPPYNLILFGHLGRNRRLDSVLQALSGLPQRDRFRLDVYGESDNPKKLRQRIRELNLTETVTLHSYAEEDRLDQALMKAHIAINLRYPTMGEASASQLRIWSRSLPSLVTKIGWYASLSEDAVAHVRPEHEVDDIQTHLTDFLNDPQRFARMGQSGRAALKHHDPETYVRTLCDVVEKSRQLRLAAIAKELARRAGSLLSPLTADPGADSVRIAQQIFALTCD